jgi:hypothetical protein
LICILGKVRWSLPRSWVDLERPPSFLPNPEFPGLKTRAVSLAFGVLTA